MLDWLLGIGESLVPSPDAHPRIQYRWRLRVGLVLCGTFAGLCVTTVLAFGLFPLVFTGFAHAGDIQQLNSRMDKSDARYIDQQLFELRKGHCRAPTEESRQLYWARMSPLLSEYQQLTGRTYILPACADL